MTAFEVTLKGEPRQRCGIKGWGVISIVVSMVKRSRGEGRKTASDEEIILEIGGLQKKPSGTRHFKWKTCPLKIGDEITIRVKNATAFDKPSSVVIEQPSQAMEAKKNYFKILKKELRNSKNP